MPLTDSTTLELVREDELWRQAYVAETADQAEQQKHRQFDTVDGGAIDATRVTGQLPDGNWREFDLTGSVTVVVFDLYGDSDWDGDVTYPEWRIRPVDPDTMVDTVDGQRFRIGDVQDLGYSAPGIGTAAGFAHRTDIELILPDSEG